MDMSKPRYPEAHDFAIVMTHDEALAVKDAITLANLIRDGHIEQAQELVDPAEYDYYEHHVAYGLRTLEPKIDKALEPLYNEVRKYMRDIGMQLGDE